MSITKLAATYMYLVCKSKVHLWRYKHINCVDFSKNALFARFASFADLDFSQASDSMTLRMNRMLCVAHYIRYVHINPLWALLQIINDGPVFYLAKVKA